MFSVYSLSKSPKFGLISTSSLFSKVAICSNQRIPSKGATLDTLLITQQPDLVSSHLTSRRSAKEFIEESISNIFNLRTKRNSLIVESDTAKNHRKTLSAEIGKLIKAGNVTEIERLKVLVDQANDLSLKADEQLKEVDNNIDKILSYLPNLLDDRVPDGENESENVLIHSWGDEFKKLGTSYSWHDELAINFGGLNIDAANKIAGSRFSVLVGDLARLERALISYFLDFHTSRGYREVSVPYIVTRSSLVGTGQLPKFENDLFKVNHNVGGEDAFLIPTAEVPVTNIYREQILDYNQLPIKHVCYTPSFRAEAGSHGRDTRGLLRQHQFHKVELVKICAPENSNDEHEKMTEDVEELLKSLNLPFRRMLLCSGDTGFSARICYDIEVWLPGQQSYREISSISNCYDFQSRRMSLRYKPPVSLGNKVKKNVNPHTLNGSGVAVGRALVAILENHQLPDGSIEIPRCLSPYMGGLTKIENLSKK